MTIPDTEQLASMVIWCHHGNRPHECPHCAPPETFDDARDAARFRWICENLTGGYGDGQTEPREKHVSLEWQQGPWIFDGSNGGRGCADEFPGWGEIVDKMMAEASKNLAALDEQPEKATELCPHGMPLAENICGPCSEGRPNRPAQKTTEEVQRVDAREGGTVASDTKIPCHASIEFALATLEHFKYMAGVECECRPCPDCEKLPKDCSGTPCASACQCTFCDYCRAVQAIEELRDV